MFFFRDLNRLGKLGPCSAEGQLYRTCAKQRWEEMGLAWCTKRTIRIHKVPTNVSQERTYQLCIDLLEPILETSQTYCWSFNQTYLWNLLPRSFKDSYGRVVQNFDWFLWSSKHCRCRLYCQICILQRVSPHEDVKGTLHHSAALAARKVHLHSPSSESLSLRRYGGAGASRLGAFPSQSFGGQSGRRSRTYELKSKFEHPEPATIGWRENSLLRKPLEDKTTDTTVDVFKIIQES